MVASESLPRIDAGAAALLDVLAAEGHVPQATYRLQFNRDFTFANARKWLPYLRDLGVSDVYASPFLKANPGSTHGYEIVDHSQLNPEVGSEADYRRFVDELHACGLRLILDVVPNHVSTAAGNRWRFDVLEAGPASQYAGYFDIDWQPPRPDMANRVLLPVLGDQFGRVLERGELRLTYEDGAFAVHYHEQVFPVAPDTYIDILLPVLERVTVELAPEDASLLELQSIITAIAYLPSRTETGPERIAEQQRERVVIRRRLQELAGSSRVIRRAIADAVEVFNGVPGEAASYDSLAGLLEKQPYRLSYWRVATEEINYRRFFDVNGLVALRMDHPEVFEAAHRFVLRLLAEGRLDGLRIDHPDGLRDPEGYLKRFNGDMRWSDTGCSVPRSTGTVRPATRWPGLCNAVSRWR